MSWFPVDDAFHGHPKARKAGLESLGLWTVSGSYCMAYLTDGFVPEWFVKEKPRGTALAKRLVDAGLWRKGVNDDGEPGFLFHDWKPECTKSHILSARENARQRKAKSRESRGPSHVTGRVTDAVSPPSCLVPTQPNPTQPNKEPLVTSSTEVTSSSTLNDARGKRLPDDWTPNPEVVAQMRSDHPHTNLKAEHAKFIDYWQSKAGKDARKTDWNATWRNWIRRASEQRSPNGINGHTTPNKLRTLAELTQQQRALEQTQLPETRSQELT